MHITILKAKLKGTLIDIQVAIECRFTLKRVRDMIRTYSQMHLTIVPPKIRGEGGFLLLKFGQRAGL